MSSVTSLQHFWAVEWGFPNYLVANTNTKLTQIMIV